MVFSKGKPKPTLSGLGIISSVVDLVLPAPNCNCNEPESIKRVANLLRKDNVNTLRLIGNGEEVAFTEAEENEEDE